jgi:anti-sigma regulatory factor (Ser/Thr protein kinase)
MERVIPHELPLAASTASVAVARRYFASIALDADLPARVRHSGALVVSELVTNAVLHGREPITLRVTTMPRTVRVAVTDGSGRPPVRRRRVPGRPLSVDAGSTDHGRGLAIVARVAQQWGCEPAVQVTGKTVWCDLAVDRSP